MHIFNIMMSRGLGGIEQAFLDYDDALKQTGHRVTNISSIGAKVNHYLKQIDSVMYRCFNIAPYCILSKLYITMLVFVFKPQIIICHGNRAINFATFCKFKHSIIIGVAHNYTYKYIAKCQFIITVTQEIQDSLVAHNIPKNKFFILPNMLRITQQYQPNIYRTPITIGSFGRLVHKKGYNILIDAINILKQDGHKINLLLGGDGPQKKYLIQKIHDMELTQEIILYGWVNNKKDFFDQIDIFCLPSLSEPFGIIILEAMLYSKPIVASKTGGPSTIITNNIDGLLVGVGSAIDLANKLQKLILNSQLGHKLSKNAYNKLCQQYDIKLVSRQLSTILQNLTHISPEK